MPKIEPIDLFHTPKGWTEVHDWIDRHAPGDRPHLYTAAGMVWNLACKITNEEKEND